jgi:hypothetical protein
MDEPLILAVLRLVALAGEIYRDRLKLRKR